MSDQPHDGQSRKDSPGLPSRAKSRLHDETSNASPVMEQEKPRQYSNKSNRDHGLFVNIPKAPAATDAALAALQYLPTPLLVLSSSKIVILANEAMGRLLGLQPSDEEAAESSENDEDSYRIPTSDMLRGQSLSQIGIDLVEHGQPIWVSWEVSLTGTARYINADQHAETIGRFSQRIPVYSFQSQAKRQEKTGCTF